MGVGFWRALVGDGGIQDVLLAVCRMTITEARTSRAPACWKGSNYSMTGGDPIRIIPHRGVDDDCGSLEVGSHIIGFVLEFCWLPPAEEYRP